MGKANLNKEEDNLWNNPVSMSSSTRQVFSLLEPAKFESFCLPFSISLPTILTPLPAQYDLHFKEKPDLVSRWEKEKELAGLSSQEDALLETWVRKDYNNYLESFSNQILGLKQLVDEVLK